MTPKEAREVLSAQIAVMLQKTAEGKTVDGSGVVTSIDDFERAIRAEERAKVQESLHWVLEMAWRYAESGGSSGPEARDYNEIMRELGWETRE